MLAAYTYEMIHDTRELQERPMCVRTGGNRVSCAMVSEYAIRGADEQDSNQDDSDDGERYRRDDCDNAPS